MRPSFKCAGAHESMWATSEFQLSEGGLEFSVQPFNASRFNVREAICQMLDLTAFPLPANLSLARVRRQKNHSGKLQSADGQLEHDGSIKEPENPRG